MIRYQKDMIHGGEENPAGGTGRFTSETLFTSEEMAGKTGMFATVTLEPGSIVGEHLHTEESEVYYILSGEAVMVEDGKRYPVSAGDAELCPAGHSHGMENNTDKPVVFLALEIKN